VTQLTPLRLIFQRTSQQHAITGEISSPAPATSQKLVGQCMAEAWGFIHQVTKVSSSLSPILLISIVQSVCTKTGCHWSPRLKCKPEITTGLLLSPHSRKPYCCLVSSVAQTPVSGMRSLMYYCLLTLLHFEVVQLGSWDDCSTCIRPPSFQGKLRYAFTFYQYLSPVCSISISECTRRGTIYYKESW
jgi:hypothetical protein